MAFDSLVLNAVVRELQQQLPGARLNKVHQPDAHTVILRYHSREGQGKLLLSAHPDNGRLHKTAISRDNPAKAPLFAMVLRKWLEGARILAVECCDGERVAWLRLEAHNDIGDTVQLRLIIEIMGKHSNIILVDEENTIIDGARRYGSSLSRYREVLPGRPYLPPPPLHKLPLPPADENALAAALYSRAESGVAEALRLEVCGLSPLLARHIALAADVLPELPTEQLGAYELSRLYQQLAELRRIIDRGAYQPCLRISAKGRLEDFAALPPLSWPESGLSLQPSMNEAVEAFYAQREQEQQFDRRRQALLKALHKHHLRLNKKISLQEADLTKCEAADAYKQAADLLSAYQWTLVKGAEQAELPSFADPEQSVVIKLDPAKSPQENVQHYYHRYAKARKARVPIEKQLLANGQELDYLLSIIQTVRDCRSIEELEQIEREAAAAHYFQRQTTDRQRREDKQDAPLPPRRYLSEDGFTILVGRHNKQNDRLSLKLAAADDMWLHTQKIPGAHVIIRREGRDIPPGTLLQAAAYAAWFSEARHSAQVPVDYLPAGQLKKPPGSRPGFVIYSGQRTLSVAPQEPPDTPEQD